MKNSSVFLFYPLFLSRKQKSHRWELFTFAQADLIMGFLTDGDHKFPPPDLGMRDLTGALFPLIYDFIFMKIYNNYSALRYTCNASTLYERIK